MEDKQTKLVQISAKNANPSSLRVTFIFAWEYVMRQKNCLVKLSSNQLSVIYLNLKKKELKKPAKMMVIPFKERVALLKEAHTDILHS